MTKINKSELSGRVFLMLSAIFIASLVTCNLIANKFVEIDLGFHVFIISAGVLPYMPNTLGLALNLPGSTGMYLPSKEKFLTKKEL